MWIRISNNGSRGFKDLLLCGRWQEFLASGRLYEAKTTCFIGTLLGDIRTFDGAQKALAYPQ
jgi:hypothetical protein